MPIQNDQAVLDAQVARRRTFAIISHPDAGKTTLTEKLLLYGGAIHLAGTVKAARAERHATSDWMELERQRGISVTSSVMQFEYGGCHINLLDTPGHQDFGEDTYRTLMAADSAIMLLDNRKGVEERTKQLFEVCKKRRLPIFTFVNKCDRIGEEPLKLLGDIETELGLQCHPLTWPVFGSTSLVGVYDRRRKLVQMFERKHDHGKTRAAANTVPLDDPTVRDAVGEVNYARLLDEIALLDEAVPEFDPEAVLDGSLSPLFFGSALTNFGVEEFLAEFLKLAPPPAPRESSIGVIAPNNPGFTGFVFKIQANMDPKHRDRVAFIRICSGAFEAGLEVLHVRTGKTIRLSEPQQFLARERVGVGTAWPGDVIGVMDRGTLRIGDTLSAIGPLEYHGIPRFPPKHFARLIPADSLKRKQLDRGVRELTEEGAVQVFFEDTVIGPVPIVAAVGLLQFDVLQFRLEHEYGAPCKLERFSYKFPRWVTGPADAIDRAARDRDRIRLYDAKGHSVFLFQDAWHLRFAVENASSIEFHEAAP